MTDVPNDTIFEREPVEGLQENAKLLFKLILLEFGKIQGHDASMTPTEIIDAYESLRRQGLLQIISDGNGGYAAKVTPTGAATAWALKHG